MFQERDLKLPHWTIDLHRGFKHAGLVILRQCMICAHFYIFEGCCYWGLGLPVSPDRLARRERCWVSTVSNTHPLLTIPGTSSQNCLDSTNLNTCTHEPLNNLVLLILSLQEHPPKLPVVGFPLAPCLLFCTLLFIPRTVPTQIFYFCLLFAVCTVPCFAGSSITTLLVILAVNPCLEKVWKIIRFGGLVAFLDGTCAS